MLITCSIHYATEPMLLKGWKILLCYLMVNQGTAYTADVNIKTIQSSFWAFYSNLSVTVNIKIEYRLEHIRPIGKQQKYSSTLLVILHNVPGDPRKAQIFKQA